MGTIKDAIYLENISEVKRILEEEKRAAQEITARLSNEETSPCK